MDFDSRYQSNRHLLVFISAFIALVMFFSPSGISIAEDTVLKSASTLPAVSAQRQIETRETDQPPTQIDGRFMVIVGDPKPEIRDEIGTQYIYVLVNNASKMINLQFPERRHYAFDPWKLNGKQVRVAGYKDSNNNSFIVVDVQAGLDMQGVEIKDIEGPRSTLVVLCKFADIQDEPEPPAYFQEMFEAQYPGQDHYWQEVSFGAVSLDPVRTVGWYMLPYNHDYYVDYPSVDLTSLSQDCLGSIDENVDPDDYDFVNMFFNQNIGCCAYGGGNNGKGGIYVPWGPDGYQSVAVVSHELGHAFGLPHSGATSGIYNNVWDVMSASGGTCYEALPIAHPLFGCMGQHTIGYHKDLLKWLPEENVFIAPYDSENTIVLNRMAQPDGSDGYLLAKLPLDESGKLLYTVEARETVGYDSVLEGSGVIIHHVKEGRLLTDPLLGWTDIVPAVIVDDDDNGYSGDDGAIWKPGETFRDESFGIEVKVEAKIANGYRVTIKRDPPPDNFSCGQSIDIPQTECDALIDIYEALNGEQWQVSVGWRQWPSVCNWYGISCQDNHVIGLDLSVNNLSGSIPPQIGKLNHLSKLALEANQITGSIPAEIGNLNNLRLLFLGGNKLSGPIPSQIWGLSNLESLSLGGNQIEGTISADIGKLENIRSIYLDMNKISGPLPPEIANLKKLRYLEIAENQLEGTIPIGIFGMDNLVGLSLRKNQMSGTIPPQIGTLRNLEWIDLSDNQLAGSIPPEVGDLVDLYTLDFSSNQISGPIPPQFGNLKRLLQLYLDDNQLIGPLPVEMASVETVEYFAFYDTHLCIPDDPALRAWLSSIATSYGTEIDCDRMGPTIVVNHDDGSPGSFFTFYGYGFSSGERQNVKANDQIIGPVDVASDRSLLFTLDTEGADGGFYDLQIGEHSPTIEIVLDIEKPIRQTEKETGKILTLPEGIARKCYRLQWEADPPDAGSIIFDPQPNCDDLYKGGSVVSVQAQKNPGYLFKLWQGDISGNENPTSFTIDADTNIVAVFKEEAILFMPVIFD